MPALFSRGVHHLRLPTRPGFQLPQHIAPIKLSAVIASVVPDVAVNLITKRHIYSRRSQAVHTASVSVWLLAYLCIFQPKSPDFGFRRNIGSVSAIDSAIFRSLFGTDEIRKVWVHPTLILYMPLNPPKRWQMASHRSSMIRHISIGALMPRQPWLVHSHDVESYLDILEVDHFDVQWRRTGSRKTTKRDGDSRISNLTPRKTTIVNVG